jgi:cardiolipin synthase (CMP-forming)
VGRWSTLHGMSEDNRSPHPPDQDRVEPPDTPAPNPPAPTPGPPTPGSPTPGTPEPRAPFPGPPNREGSPAGTEAAPVVHTPPGDLSAQAPAGDLSGPAPDGDLCAQPPDGDLRAPAPGEPELAPGPLGPSRRVSSAIRTVPNAVTLLRLLLMPVCAYLLATGRFGWGLVLTAVVGSTDWVDGWLARRYGQVSRVGQLLDPLADRLLIASVAIALVVQGVLPWAAAVLLVARDLFLLAGWPLLRRRGIEPPEVILLGKAATLVLLLALPVLTLGATGLAVAGAAHLLGLLLLWAGVAMYYLAGAVYVRMVLERLGQRERAGS